MGFRFTLIAILITGISAGDNVSELITLDNTMEWQFKDVAQLEDGSFAVALGMVFDDLVLLHLNSIGELISVQSDFDVPGRELEGGGRIITCPEGGCYVVAYSEPRATGINSDIALFKLNPDCAIKWTVQIGENTDDVYTCFGAAGAEENGLVVLGGSGYSGENAFVRRYSAGGSLVWEYELDPEEGYLPAAIGQVDNGSLVLLGHQWSGNTYLQKLDDRGNLEWDLELPFNYGFGAVSFTEVDEGYAVYFSGGDISRGGITVIVNDSGDRIGTGQFEHGMLLQDALIQNDYSVVLAGTRIIEGENVAVLESRDLQGNTNWERRLDGNGEDGFTSVFRTEDGEYALLGYSLAEESPEENTGALFIITDSDGQVAGGANASQIPFPVRVLDTGISN